MGMHKRRIVARCRVWLEWLDNWRLEAELAKVSQRYEPMLEGALKAKDNEKYEEVLHYQRSEVIVHCEPVLRRRTARLRTKARRWLVPLPPIPVATNGPDESWERAQTGDFYYLKPEAELQIRRAVRDARQKSISFWVTIVFGFLGLLIGLVSVWRR